MKDYKKSFIISNLLLVGIVLLTMNTVIFIYSHHSAIEELKTTMTQKTEPYDMIRDILRDRPQTAPNSPDGTGDNPPSPPTADGGANIENSENPSGKPTNAPVDDQNAPTPRDGGQKPPRNTRGEMSKYAKSVYVFFYNPQDEKVSVISKNELLENDSLLETAQKIYAANGDFGTVSDEDIYYYKQGAGNETKIAVASRGFIRLQMIELAAVLFAIFAAAMILFFFISKKLAERAARPLEEAMEREKQFITDASHDLKTPLTVILSDADILLRDSALPAESAKWLNSVKQAAQNMKTLIEQMLVLAESESGANADFDTVDFSDIAEECALVMESVAYEKNISYTADIESGISVTGNADYLKRIVSSLTDNALKYEPGGGEINICLKKDGSRARLTVSNRAVIPQKDIGHIFERFYRSDRARSADGSHGLGLAIVKNLTELMHGEITVQSDETNGTVFTVTMRAAK